jgi:polar amino acid transport system substrate-binding protein
MFRFVFFAVMLWSQALLADTVYLTSLDWAPYSGKALAEQGASVAVAKAAFKAVGHELVVDFYPWSRAVKLASDATSKYSGYFPEYFYQTDEFTFSEAMGKGPLGLVENKAKPLSWSTVQDLKQYKLGVVQDYVNTEELDQLIASGELKVSAVPSDDVNIKKVGGARIDAAVIDANVLNYSLNHHTELQAFKSSVQMNSKLLTEKELFIAFKTDEKNKKWRELFNQGLKKINIDMIMSQYLSNN